MNSSLSSGRLFKAARAISRCALWTGSNVPPRTPMSAAFPFMCPQPLLAKLSVANYDVLLRRQSLEPHRAARMQLVGGDADLCAQAVFIAVGKARRGIPHHRAR